jgi:hypothetical protein
VYTIDRKHKGVNVKNYILHAIIGSTLLQAQSDSHITLKSLMVYKEFSNSKQKNYDKDYAVGVDGVFKKHRLELLSHYSHADTQQPPLPKDLEVQKSFIRYRYTLHPQHTLGMSYMHITDNIAPTDGGKIYGLSYFYHPTPKLQIKVAHYLSDYQAFDVSQNDIAVVYRSNISTMRFGVTAMAKYIWLEKYSNTLFNPRSQVNSANDYTSIGLKLDGVYKSFYGMGSVWFGKRMFGVMNDGYGVQHHAMEFDQSYTLGIGKKFKNFNVMLKYRHEEATELPINNPDVELDSYQVMFSYKF